MLNLIPTPNFAEINEAKTLKQIIFPICPFAFKLRLLR